MCDFDPMRIKERFLHDYDGIFDGKALIGFVFWVLKCEYNPHVKSIEWIESDRGGGQEENSHQNRHIVDNFYKRYDCDVSVLLLFFFSFDRESFRHLILGVYMLCVLLLLMYQAISTRFGHNSKISHSIFSPYVLHTYYSGPPHLSAIVAKRERDTQMEIISNSNA